MGLCFLRSRLRPGSLIDRIAHIQARVSCVQLRGASIISRSRRIVSSVITIGVVLTTDMGNTSQIHQNIKEKIVASTEQDTVHIFRTLRNTARVFKNPVSQQVVALERRPGGAKFEELRDLVSGQRGKLVYEKGDPDLGIWSAGIVMGLIKDIPTCEELLRRIEAEAEAAIEGMSKLRVPAKAKL